MGIKVGSGGGGGSVSFSNSDLIADPDADRIVFWDDSAGDYVALVPDSNHLAISGTTLSLASTISGISAIDAVDITASDLTDGSNLFPTTVPDLADPGADRITFWDDSAGSFAHLTVGSGLTLSDTTLTGASSSDPTSSYYFVEDFDGSAGLTYGSWNAGNSGAGSPGLSQVTSPISGSVFGVMSQSTGTDTTGRSTYRRWHASFQFGSGVVTIWAKVRFPTLSDGTDTYTYRVGSIDADTSDGTDGIFFRYTNGVNSGKWEGVVIQGGVATAVDLGVAVAANTWYTLKSVTNSAGTSTEFFINGASGGTNANTHPSTADLENCGIGFSIQKSAGTNARTALIDFIAFRKDFDPAR
jgi:hypothetical protein